MSDRAPPPRVEGDRTVSLAAGTGWWTTRRAIAAGACGLMVILAFIVWKNSTPSKPDKNALPEKPTLAFATQNPYRPPPAEPPPPVQRVVTPPPPVFPTQQPAQQDMGKALSPQAAPAASAPPVYYSYAVPPLPEQFNAKKHQTAKETDGTNASGATTIMYKGQAVPGLKAGNMGDTALMLPPGVIICTMSSVIESTVPGQFTCTIEHDVKSPAGVVLLDAGSYILGTYDTKVANGQRRLRANSATAWDLKTSCVAPLGGAMADGLGRAGLEGDYDPHTWEKLGGAVGLMVLENLTSLGQAALQSGNNNSYFSLNTGSMSSIANELLRANANIPPTITIHQGSIAGVWIDSPIDFSSCYRLAATER
jgi:type IV secretory pathway VirB10-like protein